MVSELKIIIKDDEKKLQMEELIYEDYTVSENDPVIKSRIDKLISEFVGEPTDIQIRISMDL